MSRVKNEIIRMLEDGYTYNHIASELNCSKATISYHAKKIGKGRQLPIHNWEEIQSYYDIHKSFTACRKKFGISWDAWVTAKNRGLIQHIDFRIPLEEILVVGRTQNSRKNIKIRLINAGLKEDKCEGCGLTEWKGKKITMELHHINGINNDDRLENLEFLCPNCHAQTETYGGKNKKIK
jgi:hypothetical protein